jgi:uncharacterized protein
MKVIIDCNIWISFLLGRQTELIQHILTDPRLEVYICKELLHEIQEVTERDKIRKYVNSDDVSTLFSLLHIYCKFVKIGRQAESPIRDAKDLYLLSLAETVKADVIVSGDKDLLVLEKHGKTRMITLANFKESLGYQSTVLS